MQRRKYAIFGSTILALLLVAMVWCGPSWNAPPLSQQSSPDGTLSVAVFGLWQFDGTYEVLVHVRDSQGQVVHGGALMVGFAKDKATAERDYAVSFESNKVAHVGRVRRLKKAEFFR